MQIILRDATGGILDGILVRATPQRLRIVMRGYDDTVELTLTKGRWISAEGNAVEIEALLADSTSGGTIAGTAPRPRTTAAGS